MRIGNAIRLSDVQDRREAEPLKNRSLNLSPIHLPTSLTKRLVFAKQSHP